MDEQKALVYCMAQHIAAINRDGLENSLSHFQKLDEDCRALYALMEGKETELPLHVVN